MNPALFIIGTLVGALIAAIAAVLIIKAELEDYDNRRP